ncbi:DUF2063 domain-containing protein [Marinibactrum halimedae]|uniref:DUF2063 domain-containing protein n=1 Tax=Marinibactrum halimedae TaxID=1444977 RepID=A0AA37T474_9GAMM|nr:putative DNA-binding domain-containing protein [Marinibactrum halimedae]MCD9459131.1 putative DNA-binding domain-containing protein [Marinibactrum halimedae]GLS24733.1 hypothetical protein GCM10007877_04470 [Marinibactrum halimedae]
MEETPGPMATFQQTQVALAEHLRDPDNNPGIDGVEDRRLKIYRDLIFNNIEGFIASGFPVLRSLIEDDHWHTLVRGFVVSHQCHTPYFLEISQEFLAYLQQEYQPEPWTPDFIRELAHYEWVELALDVSTETFPTEIDRNGDLLNGQPVVSPLVWSLSYQYPVHHIGPDFQPESPPELPTFLLVYRTREDEVRFMETNAVTSRLLQLLQGESEGLLEGKAQRLTGREALLVIASELQAPDPEQIVSMGLEILQQLHNCDILCGTRL